MILFLVNLWRKLWKMILKPSFNSYKVNGVVVEFHTYTLSGTFFVISQKFFNRALKYGSKAIVEEAFKDHLKV